MKNRSVPGSGEETRSCQHTLRTTVACFVLMILAGCGEPEPWTRLDPGVPAPPFTLTSLQGEKMSLSDYAGQVVVVEFWATWCGPCRFSTPSLEVVYRRYRDRGVTMLLINQGETPEAVASWAEDRFTAPILMDRDGRVGRRYSVEGIPRLMVIDQEGRIVHDHSGYGGGLERELSAFLDSLLAAEPQPADV